MINFATAVALQATALSYVFKIKNYGHDEINLCFARFVYLRYEYLGMRPFGV